MKNSTLLSLAAIFAICSFSMVSFGQEVKPWKVRRAYLNGSLGTDGIAGIQFNLHFNNKWMGFASFNNAVVESKNLPDDYKAGTFSFMGVEFPLSNPTEEFNVVTLGMGRVITPASDKAWVIATGGISVGQYQENQFSPQQVEGFDMIIIGGTTSNYATSTKNKTIAGITAGFEGHVNLFRFMGLSTGTKLLLTNQGVYPYLNFGMNLGLMRPARKNMISNAK